MEVSETKKPAAKGWLTATIVLAVVGVGAPMLGLAGTVIGMIGAFSTLRTTGGADPEALAGDINTSLLTTAAGLVVCAVAGVGSLICLCVYLSKRPKEKDQVP